MGVMELAWGLAALSITLRACSLSTPMPTPEPLEITPAVVTLATARPTDGVPVQPIQSLAATHTPTPASTATPDPNVSSVCTRPPDDRTHVQIDGETISARTLWMLKLAQHLYGGPGSMLRVVQGSYAPGLKLSFGTHDAGGAVDISIRDPANPSQVLWDEAPRMAKAMRQAGLAAWYRPVGILGPDSPAHIHAIAIGDPELSDAARRQLDGPEGYFRGLDAIPPNFGGPHPDPHGGPLICPWMLDMGYKDLRQ